MILGTGHVGGVWLLIRSFTSTFKDDTLFLLAGDEPLPKQKAGFMAVKERAQFSKQNELKVVIINVLFIVNTRKVCIACVCIFCTVRSVTPAHSFATCCFWQPQRRWRILFPLLIISLFNVFLCEKLTEDGSSAVGGFNYSSAWNEAGYILLPQLIKATVT